MERDGGALEFLRGGIVDFDGKRVGRKGRIGRASAVRRTVKVQVTNYVGAQ